jgi:hypothetical protein
VRAEKSRLETLETLATRQSHALVYQSCQSTESSNGSSKENLQARMIIILRTVRSLHRVALTCGISALEGS